MLRIEEFRHLREGAALLVDDIRLRAAGPAGPGAPAIGKGGSLEGAVGCVSDGVVADLIGRRQLRTIELAEPLLDRAGLIRPGLVAMLRQIGQLAFQRRIFAAVQPERGGLLRGQLDDLIGEGRQIGLEGVGNTGGGVARPGQRGESGGAGAGLEELAAIERKGHRYLGLGSDGGMDYSGLTGSLFSCSVRSFRARSSWASAPR